MMREFKKMVTNYVRAFYYLQNMLRNAYWDYEKLINYQNKKLKKIIQYAYNNVPFYHYYFKKNGIRPEDIKNSKDLNKLPIIRKNDIRNNYEDFISKEFKKRNLITISTSGSSGKPLYLHISQAEDEFRKAKHLRANISLGQKPRDRWVIITSPHHFGTSTKIQRFFNLYVPTPISVFDDVSIQLFKIERFKPKILDGYSSSLLLLAKEVEKRKKGYDQLKFIIGGSELIDIGSRHFIESVFDVPFYDQYACIEFERIAWQCPEKVGYHMDFDSLVLQFVDQDNEVSSGESGEIICTSLFNYAMPLIRYATGDAGIQSDEKCSCGRRLPLMKVVEGRTDSFLYFPNNRVMSPRAFTVAMSTFKDYAYIDQFRIVQKEIDHIIVFIKLKNNLREEAVFSRNLCDYLRRTLSLDMDNVLIEIKFVDNIPLDKTGKLMMVVSELDKSKTAYA